MLVSADLSVTKTDGQITVTAGDGLTYTYTIVIANDAAVAGTNVLGASTAAGSLCVRVYDVGAVSTPVTYQIQVTHL